MSIEGNSKRRSRTKRKLLQLAGSDGTTSEKLLLKLYIFQNPPIRAEEGFSKYMLLSYEGRRQYLRSNAHAVNRLDEWEFFRNAHKKVHNIIVNDPHLSGNWRLFPTKDKNKLGKIFIVLGQRGMIAQEKGHKIYSDHGIANDPPEGLNKYLPTYVPPFHRIKITENLTFNKNDVIPVYSDLPNETVESLEIPDSLLFDYIDTNFLNMLTEKNLAKAVFMSQKEENLIRCNCCSTTNPIVPCYKNDKCPCYLINKEMQTLQKNTDNYPLAEFTTFDPILFAQPQGHFHKHAGFACSELCACKGNCTNNSLMIPSKKLFPIEIYRNNEKLGFGIRSSVVIPAGTPVMEFVGELVESTNMENESVDYAYQIAYPDDEKWQSLLKSMPFEKNYKDLLLKLCDQLFFIDPKVYGNVGRTACHSCSANMEVVRIFQKSLSPAHIRLMMISLVDIFPGTPLTFDYGSGYVKERFNRSCECGSFTCLSGKEYNIYGKMFFTEYTVCHRQLNDLQYKDWKENVHDVLADR